MYNAVWDLGSFWASTFLPATWTYIETNGTPLNLQFAALLSRRTLPLALSNAILASLTRVPLAKTLATGRTKYRRTDVIIQYSQQTLAFTVTSEYAPLVRGRTDHFFSGKAPFSASLHRPSFNPVASERSSLPKTEPSHSRLS